MSLSISNLWYILKNYQFTSFKNSTVSKSNSITGWSGNGYGSVFIEVLGNHTFLSEKGRFIFDNGKSISTENEYLFIKNINGDLSLSHTRFGRDKPVFLFNIKFDAKQNKWLSIESHLCVKDYYSCEIYSNKNNLHLDWKIIGPHKNETINCTYS